MSGVDIASCKIKAFTVASIFGTVAGAMYAHYMGYINPSTFNLDLSTNYVVMLMVGGLGSVVGTIFGSAIVTILPGNAAFPGQLLSNRVLFYHPAGSHILPGRLGECG